jgi:hypothetical protein
VTAQSPRVGETSPDGSDVISVDRVGKRRRPCDPPGLSLDRSGMVLQAVFPSGLAGGTDSWNGGATVLFVDQREAVWRSRVGRRVLLPTKRINS